MIESFKDKQTKELFETGLSKNYPADVTARAVRKLDMINSACVVEDLQTSPSNRLNKLLGKRKEQYSISVNNKCRICFEFDNGNARNVEMCDYHH